MCSVNAWENINLFFFLKKENIIQKLKFNLSSPPKNKEGGLCCFCCCFQPWALQMCDDVPSDLSLFIYFFYSCRKYLMVRSTAYQMIKKKKKNHNKSDLTSSVFHAPNSDFSQIWNHIQLLNPIWKYIRFHVLFADQTAENLWRSSQKYQKKKNLNWSACLNIYTNSHSTNFWAQQHALHFISQNVFQRKKKGGTNIALFLYYGNIWKDLLAH